MKRERWLILTFVPALVLFNAFVVLNYTGLSYQPFAYALPMMSYPDGTPCGPTTPCDSGNCVTGVCCDTACPAPGNCLVPGRVGTCVDPAPAPALSGFGLLIGALMLAGVGTVGLMRKRRLDG